MTDINPEIVEPDAATLARMAEVGALMIRFDDPDDPYVADDSEEGDHS